MGKMTKPSKAEIVDLLNEALPYLMVDNANVGLIARIGTILIKQNPKKFADSIMQVAAIVGDAPVDKLPTLDEREPVAGA